MTQKGGWLYIITNRPKGTLYVGVTSNIQQRIIQHKNSVYQDSFSSTYNCKLLVYMERFETISEAIVAEKRIKNWHRPWKIRLIEKLNPEWRDLSIDSDGQILS